MNEIEKKIIESLKNLSSLSSLHLFGSFAKDKADKKSDVDIAVLFEPGAILEPFDLISLQEDLSGTLERDVDLICLNTASPILALQVLEHGKILEIRNKAVYDHFVMKTMSDYADLKRLRKPLEDKISERKYYD